MVALAALALVILRGGGEGVTGRGVIVTSGLVMVLACLVILWGRGEGVIGRGVMVTSDLVLAGVVKREAEDCDEEVAEAMSQPPPNRLSLIGGSMKLSGLSILFLLTSDWGMSSSQDSSSVAGAGVDRGNRVEFWSGLKQVTSALDSISADSRTKSIISATSMPPV